MKASYLLKYVSISHPPASCACVPRPAARARHHIEKIVPVSNILTTMFLIVNLHPRADESISVWFYALVYAAAAAPPASSISQKKEQVVLNNNNARAHAAIENRKTDEQTQDPTYNPHTNTNTHNTNTDTHQRPMTTKKKVAFLDCKCGVAGDMLLGALIDAVSTHTYTHPPKKECSTKHVSSTYPPNHKPLHTHTQTHTGCTQGGAHQGPQDHPTPRRGMGAGVEQGGAEQRAHCCNTCEGPFHL